MTTAGLSDRSKWIALIVLCLGSLMIVLDTTIVNVALPSIREDLGFSQTSLAWVVNAYMLTFGGFLLLGGRLGDHFGHRRLFIGGIALFTVVLARLRTVDSQTMLVAARAIQGLGGAVVSAVSLSLIVALFVEPGNGPRRWACSDSSPPAAGASACSSAGSSPTCSTGIGSSSSTCRSGSPWPRSRAACSAGAQELAGRAGSTSRAL